MPLDALTAAFGFGAHEHHDVVETPATQQWVALTDPGAAVTAADKATEAANAASRAVGLPMSPMPGAGSALIFQDVDGVLNHNPHQGPLDPNLLKNLSWLVNSTQAKIVLSTNWRKSEAAVQYLRDRLEDAGIPADRVVGTTPVLCDGVECRSEEIKEWLHVHPDIAASTRYWTAIDDRDVGSQDPSFMNGHFVRTSAADGLTREKAREAAGLLLGKMAL
eukprot:gnl/TRDRNA2_/TRDRNA2_198027_c0_seq1.p1 gnl/TRDRNA2_/TRDRNA2_198027_c0~~gnl/TRDRNA2_/TRDRNA2_198027_c0_seq1.p1  ORF type:complete len:220 (-),score=33.26 gnl/TRDRNA2_/TRDRNA2_198027_c0_seq1:60-719(-)